MITCQEVTHNFTTMQEDENLNEQLYQIANVRQGAMNIPII
jgi:hypothetical protein